MRVLVAEPLAEEGIDSLKKEADVDVRLDLDPQALLDVISEYDAVIVRSATKITKDVIDRGENLKVIGRAGSGVDNIDVDAATRRGVVVVNAPQSNILAAAEHTMALILAMARNIPAAHASLREGKWERGLLGAELNGKTLGIIGLGRIGSLVAQRASAFGMRLVACDPFVSRSRAAQLGIELLPTHQELYAVADFITVHVPKSPENMALLSDKEFEQMKPGVRVINVARGGIVDEKALLRALESGQVAGAALDVFEKEPPGEDPLLKHPGVVATPHLAGSTEEAQTKAGAAIAEQVLLALRGEFAPYAVNVEGGAEYVEALRPFMALTENLGKVMTGIAGAGVSAIHFEFHGTLAEHDTKILTLAGLKGVFAAIVHEPVTYVNAPILAADRGIEVQETKNASSRDYVNLVVLRAESDDGRVTVAGSLVGKKDQQRIVRVYDYEFDMLPERYMCFLRYADRPGVIGKVGTVLGEAGINIASMDVSRETIGGEALMGLTVDSVIPADVVESIQGAIDARDARFIDLGPGTS